MQVSFAPNRLQRAQTRAGDNHVARPLLSPRGARVVLGGEALANGLARSIVPAANTLFGPRGACLASERGPLFVCDTGHHRLMIWRRPPSGDQADADMLIGQPDFSREGRNARGEVGAATLNMPTGVAAYDGILAVADAWNHRVLIWHGYPESSNQPADVVLGQADFTGGLANRGASQPTAATLNWCYGVAIADGKLIVADTGNRRVLIWDAVPTVNDTPADVVLGQRDFVTRDDNAGEAGGALGMRWPHGIAVTGGMLYITDAGNNRVMAWRNFPRTNGAACDFVIGQADFMGLDHNRASYYPTSSALNMPYGLTVHGGMLVVIDTANSRLLGFELDGLAMDSSAIALAGQPLFSDKGDNRWRFAGRDSVCWPYSAAACGNQLVVADAGNNRVLLWEAAS
ncbi:NHL repeat containing protein [Bradyrhizobium sp. LTSPM299]|uniref:NHL repeat-containing protein n=1 Tax=Bradyrhizobium sp. LTSPM299 TaxID=1619233 RepID=UPI0005DB7DC7|nr:NHL repeat-containing protein [Bradyrhizobium sp. LTSPM299]KJC56430.1 NHL repeat containing protein [Bradyrhizobium sp. LTSPM299]